MQTANQRFKGRRIGALRGFAGGVTPGQESQVAGAAASAGTSALVAGTSIGAAAGPIGAAAGALVGVVVGILSQTNNTASHIGTWDQQLLSAVNAMPSSVFGLGRQFAWNENSHGLVQMIEAALACGVYMSWDSSLISNYDVCANWAVTFGNAVQAVSRTMFLNPYKPVSVSIALSPGAGGVAPFTFGFNNPNENVGPDGMCSAVIMGKGGLMEAMMTALGGQNPANIVANGTNATAQKIFSLMIDYWWGQYLPNLTPSTLIMAPNVTAAITAAATAANTAATTTNTNPQTAATVAATVAVSPPPPAPVVTGTTASGTPVVAPADTGALVSNLVASGTEPSQAIQVGNASLEANGIDSTAPASQAQLQSDVAPSSGLSTTDLLLIAAVGIAGVGGFYIWSRGK
jgi:hypothetical protein